MRKILSFSIGLSFLAAAASPALAVDKCNIPPPKWWFAPKVTNVYEGGGRSYASSSQPRTVSHFSAQRRYEEPRYTPTRFRDPYRGW
jgi:hypothetical protein